MIKVASIVFSVIHLVLLACCALFGGVIVLNILIYSATLYGTLLTTFATMLGAILIWRIFK